MLIIRYLNQVVFSSVASDWVPTAYYFQFFSVICYKTVTLTNGALPVELHVT